MLKDYDIGQDSLESILLNSVEGKTTHRNITGLLEEVYKEARTPVTLVMG